jgi:hypothetical protein
MVLGREMQQAANGMKYSISRRKKDAGKLFKEIFIYSTYYTQPTLKAATPRLPAASLSHSRERGVYHSHMLDYMLMAVVVL